MKLTIFGATGPSGRELVRQALDGGHSVTAFVRDPARLPFQHERLSVARGDVLDQAAVDAAVAGRDAVISALGINRGSPKTIHADGTKRIVAAMERHGVRRYIGLSAFGAGDSRDGSLYVRLTWALLRPNLEDKQRHEELIRASELDWTLIRPPRLTNGPATGRYRTGSDIRMRPTAQVSRADVAAFALSQLDDDEFVRRAPAIARR